MCGYSFCFFVFCLGGILRKSCDSRTASERRCILANRCFPCHTIEDSIDHVLLQCDEDCMGAFVVLFWCFWVLPSFMIKTLKILWRWGSFGLRAKPRFLCNLMYWTKFNIGEWPLPLFDFIDWSGSCWRRE